MKALRGYYKISRHYRWALSQVFDEMDYQYVLIVEGEAKYSNSYDVMCAHYGG